MPVTDLNHFINFQNGSFEGTPDSSQYLNGYYHTFSRVADAYEGTYSFRCKYASAGMGSFTLPAGGNQYLVTMFSGKPQVQGRTYTYQGKIKLKLRGYIPVGKVIKVQVRTGGGSWVDVGNFADNLGTWLPFTCTGVAVANQAGSIAARLYNAEAASVTVSLCEVCFDSFTAIEESPVPAYTPMEASAVSTNVTTNGGSDGAITLTVTGGSGNRIYKWWDGYGQPEFGSRLFFAQVNLGGFTSLTLDGNLTGANANTYVVLSGGSHDGIYRIVANQIVDYAVTTEIPYNAGNNFAGTTVERYYFPTSQNRTGLVEGAYHVTITDITTSEVIDLYIIVSEPGIVRSPGSLLEVPTMNSITFVVQEDISQCDNPQGLDNRLLCEQEYEGFDETNYFQKFNICDNPVTQFNSDYLIFIIELRKYANDALVKTFSYELKENNIGVTEDFTITIRNHTVADQSRIYFTAGALPIPLSIGDPFEILNNTNGYNGNFTIVDIINDITVGYQYLVINKTYTGPGLIQNGTGRFLASTADFNVFESLHILNDVPEGDYYIYIKAFDEVDDINFKTAISEPIAIRNTHPDTVQIKYRNIDNAFDMTWTTGYQGMVRIPSHFGHKRSPGGERATNRNSDYKLIKVSAKKTRVLLFQVWSLPPYMHEKLSTIFDCDNYTLNEIECQTSEGYGEPEYKERFLLANSSIKLEAKWYDRYNSDDLGSVGDGGFIITETGFLKR